MKHFRIDDMHLGFFVGDFEPTVFRTNAVEMAIKQIAKGTLDGGYYREIDTEIINVLSGEVECNGEHFQKGDILLFTQGEMISIFALEDSNVLISKLPGTKGDVKKAKWDDYNSFDAYYSSYLAKLKTLMKNGGIDDAPLINDTARHIDNSDISVVVQGYADDSTSYLLNSIRKYLPGSTIILSTWDYCEVSKLDYDTLVISDDPGAVPCEIWSNFDRGNNGNRQIVSTKSALNKVETKYVLKLRSDLVLLGDGFKDYLYLLAGRDNDHSVFSERIVIGELFSRHDFVYHRNGKEYDVPKPFHPSDWFAFGLTEDVKKLYGNVNIIPDNEIQYDKLVHQDYVEKYDYKYSWRYTTEQHILLEALKDKMPRDMFRDWTDWNEENIEYSRKIMLNNFVFLDMARSDILNMKYITASFANNGLRHPEKKLYIFEELKNGTF
ncbi:MAG: hypothetical protein IKO10_11110 [Lachnospiraceae bacterium]|nr:hypothetical protein [Lachnospiraceae bacterium]